MKIIADTNVLIRAVVCDDQEQAQTAIALLQSAERIAVSSTSLCEFVWVLRRTYKFELHDILTALDALLAATNVSIDRPATEAGVAMLKDGGDFADGLIAYQGAWLGGELFAFFDKKAVSLLASRGQRTRLLS